MINSFYFLKDSYDTFIGEFFRSTRLFIRIVRLKLPVREVSSVIGFNAALSQYGIKLNDFILEFDKKTLLLETGFLIRLSLLILLDRKFMIVIKKITSVELIYNFSKELRSGKLILKPLNLYKIFLIKSDFSKTSNKSMLRIILGTVHSYKHLFLLV